MSRNLCYVCLVAGVVTGGSWANPPPPPRPLPAGELIRRLASEDYWTREEATKQLLHHPVAPPELLAALNSPDPEVRKRATELIAKIRQRTEDRMLARGNAFATGGAADLFIASTASWELPAADSRLWLPGYALSRQLFDRAGQKYTWPPPSTTWLGPLHRKDLYEYRKRDWPRPARTDEVFEWYPPQAGPGWGNGLVMAGGVRSRKAVSNSLIVSRGDFRIGKEGDTHIERFCGNSLVFANGDVIVGVGLYQSVIVSDGNVEASGIRDCLVIARGDIKGLAQGSVLIAGGKVRVAKENGDRQEQNHIVEGANNPLGFITFFELARVGLEVNAANGAVTVAAVKAGSAGATAGFKAGDIVLDVGGKKPADAEALRRLLRDALAVGDAAVKLKRGNETVTVKLALPE